MCRERWTASKRHIANADDRPVDEIERADLALADVAEHSHGGFLIEQGYFTALEECFAKTNMFKHEYEEVDAEAIDTKIDLEQPYSGIQTSIFDMVGALGISVGGRLKRTSSSVLTPSRECTGERPDRGEWCFTLHVSVVPSEVSVRDVS